MIIIQQYQQSTPSSSHCLLWFLSKFSVVTLPSSLILSLLGSTKCLEVFLQYFWILLAACCFPDVLACRLRSGHSTWLIWLGPSEAPVAAEQHWTLLATHCNKVNPPVVRNVTQQKTPRVLFVQILQPSSPFQIDLDEDLPQMYFQPPLTLITKYSKNLFPFSLSCIHDTQKYIL